MASFCLGIVGWGELTSFSIPRVRIVNASSLDMRLLYSGLMCERWEFKALSGWRSTIARIPNTTPMWTKPELPICSSRAVAT